MFYITRFKQREPTEGRAARFKYEVRKRSLLAGGDLNLSRVVVVVVSPAVVGRVFGSSTSFYRRAKRWQAPWWEIKTPGTRGLFLCSVRDLPWADPPLPGTKRDQKGVRATTGKLGIFLIWVFCRRPQFSVQLPNHLANFDIYLCVLSGFIGM